MISVEEALAACLALVRPAGTESVKLADAMGRVLATDVVAGRDQPPFAASAMDGYAMALADRVTGARLSVVGEAPAGRAWAGQIGAGQALRIFTGAPLPRGADCVVVQEDVAREADTILLGPRLDEGSNIRAAGCDFRAGARLAAPRRLSPADIALCAAMNAPVLDVFRRPEVALIATGDELVSPGEAPRDDQIIASNIYGLKAMIEAEGCRARLLPIARDNCASLTQVLALAQGADLIVTIGGASVGEHDLVAGVTAGLGLERSFYKVALRPGKPLMAGRLGGRPCWGCREIRCHPWCVARFSWCLCCARCLGLGRVRGHAGQAGWDATCRPMATGRITCGHGWKRALTCRSSHLMRCRILRF